MDHLTSSSHTYLFAHSCFFLSGDFDWIDWWSLVRQRRLHRIRWDSVFNIVFVVNNVFNIGMESVAFARKRVSICLDWWRRASQIHARAHWHCYLIRDKKSRCVFSGYAIHLTCTLASEGVMCGPVSILALLLQYKCLSTKMFVFYWAIRDFNWYVINVIHLQDSTEK